MSLKMVFLGSGSAFTVGFQNYQSNVLFELDKDTLLIDAGTDIRHSLFEHHKGS
jgi:ribonuclease BN (tRNA processing enzyme)